MRLSKIKLAGFKSFVDPTTITFPSSLVGVVGPNGCGKSNVIDAVRWVMGESSASRLRGEWDPEKEKTISASSQQSAIDYNVFEGKTVKGLPRFTLTRGYVAVHDGEIRTKEGHGEFVRREANNPVNKALSSWKELTAPRPVERSGIPATGV